MTDINETKLRQIDFSLLLIFQEVYRSRRLTSAAEKMRLSQPAVSHALGRLRQIIGAPLFVRRPDGLKPTARADELAPRVDAIIRLTDETLQGPEPFVPATSRRLFRISANDFVGSLLTEPLISLFTLEAPSARLALSFAGGPTQAFRKLRESDLDLAIGRFPDLPDDCLATRLFEDTYQVVARAGHPRLAGGLNLEIYLDLRHLIVSFAGDLVGTIDEYLTRQGLARKVVASSPMFLSAFAAVAKSDLVVTAPSRLAKRFAANFGLQTWELPFTPDTVLMDVVRAQHSTSDHAIDWLLTNMIALLQ